MNLNGKIFPDFPCTRNMLSVTSMKELTFNVQSAPIGTVMSMAIVAKVHRFVQSGI
jgi:hypothetical protein